MKITFYEELPKHFEKKMVEGLDHYSISQKNVGKNNRYFALIIEDDKGNFQAGLYCLDLYGCLELELLFVDENQRDKGYGSQLVKEAEEVARKRGCLLMSVETMDFGAAPFYEKHGFEIDLVREGYEGGTKRYYLRKSL